MTARDQSPGGSWKGICSTKFRETLLTIDGNLGVQDVEVLKFLCQDFLSHRKLGECQSAWELFDQLLIEEQLCEEDPFLLAELLYTSRQKSLLKYLGYTKERVQQLLPARRRISLFRNLLYELSEGIDSEHLKRMIFLQREVVPKTEMTSLSFLAHLEKKDRIGEDNLTTLENLCQNVAPNLLKNIDKYKREKTSQAVIPPRNQKMELLNQEEEQLKPVSQFNGMLEAAVYRMDRKHRGYCVIVNNHSFISLADRNGTHKDAEQLFYIFQWLGFTVQVYQNVTERHLEDILQEYKSHPGHADGDCFVFCVLTHGKLGAVYSSDEALIPIRRIVSHFTAQQCPGLADKPKLFFIQACQGEHIQIPVSIVPDALNPEHASPPAWEVNLQDSIPNEADFLLGLATVPGYVSFRHVLKGSWYIQSLCNHLKNLVPRAAGSPCESSPPKSNVTLVNQIITENNDSQSL
ncbi:caspase-10 isoform X2 [Dasypus novemcinctus]|uniref:caspase-10 isoform X2 n=1 Tax=Dasypus novemcinctus TaxID=9361 RepID=UPI00265F6F7B|nr:caspase-10 isoform X2 [Dasypus novemcinctus]